MRTGWLALLALCLLACGRQAPDGFAAYIINQDAHAQVSPGKSYDAEPCSVQLEGNRLRLRCGRPESAGWLLLEVDMPEGKSGWDSLLGLTLEGAKGDLKTPDRQDRLELGKFTLQTLKGGVARGNFSARLVRDSALEVVGSFEAKQR